MARKQIRPLTKRIAERMIVVPAVWEVTSVLDQTIFNPATGPQPGKRINFRLLDGTVSFVDVPLGQFNKDNVAKLIDEAAHNLYDVLSLAGPEMPEQPQPEPFTLQ